MSSTTRQCVISKAWALSYRFDSGRRLLGETSWKKGKEHFKQYPVVVFHTKALARKAQKTCCYKETRLEPIEILLTWNPTEADKRVLCSREYCHNLAEPVNRNAGLCTECQKRGEDHVAWQDKRVEDLKKELKEQGTKHEKLEQLLDRREGRRLDCQVCGKMLAFPGAIFCSMECFTKYDRERKEAKTKQEKGKAK